MRENVYIQRQSLKPMNFYLFILFYFLTLQYCIGFAIYQNQSATDIHVFSILNPLPSSLPIPSLWVVPVHQPQASSMIMSQIQNWKRKKRNSKCDKKLKWKKKKKGKTIGQNTSLSNILKKVYYFYLSKYQRLFPNR